MPSPLSASLAASCVVRRASWPFGLRSPPHAQVVGRLLSLLILWLGGNPLPKCVLLAALSDRASKFADLGECGVFVAPGVGLVGAEGARDGATVGANTSADMARKNASSRRHTIPAGPHLLKSILLDPPRLAVEARPPASRASRQTDKRWPDPQIPWLGRRPYVSPFFPFSLALLGSLS